MSRSRLPLALLLVVLIAPAARAQEAVPAAGSAAATSEMRAAPTAGTPAQRIGPAPAALRIGIASPTEPAVATAPVMGPDVSKTSRRTGRALAIVGAAGLITGAIIGDDAGTVIMVGSGVLGLFGLYFWIR
ncbi:MAG: hypothetical protein ACOY71_13690 [Gemmatimonadota bacterium]